MINRYLLTDEVIRKYTRINCRKYIISNLIVDIIFMIWCINRYLYYNSKIFLYLIGVFAIMVFLIFFRVNKTIKLEIERMRIRYGDEPQYMNIEINDQINIAVKENTMNIPFDKVIKHFQTKEFVMVKVKGKMVVILKKDSFVQGSYEECLALLDKICA